MNPATPDHASPARLRIPLLGIGALALLAALAAALIRTGWSLLLVSGSFVGQHGPLRLKPDARRLFNVATGLFAAGLAVTLVAFDIGLRLMGVGLIALGAWLLRHDVARRTIRASQLP